MSENRALQQGDQVVSPADERGVVPREPAPSDAGFPAPATPNRYPLLAVCGLLLLAVALIYGQTIRHEFVNYDDGDFVYQNPHVSHGLTAEGITWALTHFHGHYWIPLSRFSCMLDCQLYGLNPGGHHLTNVLLHAATAVLLFLVLRAMTGGFWPSAVVAALFAVHPLHVESVAWVTERKDVLSGLFFTLTLGAYVGYVRHRFAWVRYLTVIGVFALGLIAKPMLVTLPLVLLLLDYWPLRRTSESPHGRFSLPLRCVIDKIPLLLLVALFCGVTYWTMSEGLASKEQLHFSWRINNALVAYVGYLGQFLCPLGLTVFYPHPGPTLPVWKIIAAGLVLASVSAGTLAYRRRYPYLLVGWLWYLGMLVPVIGLVQVGTVAMADRFTYLPQIGLCIALAWGAADVCRSWSFRRWWCGITSALVLVTLMGCAWRQTSFWRNSELLWSHTLACTSRNAVAHFNLAFVLAPLDRLDEAVAHYRQGLEIVPLDADAHYQLGLALQKQGKMDDALAHFQQAVKINPDCAEAHYSLALAWVSRGRFDEAIALFQRALAIKPDYAEACNNLGAALQTRGRIDEAMVQYRQALKIKPDYARVYYNLGAVLAGRGQFDEAIAQFRRALEIKPDDVDTHNNLAWLLATCPAASLRNGTAAIEHAQRASQLCGGRRADVLGTLAAAYAEAGRFPEALATARKALALATQQKHRTLVDVLRARIALYEAGKPSRQTLPASPRPR